MPSSGEAITLFVSFPFSKLSLPFPSIPSHPIHSAETTGAAVCSSLDSILVDRGSSISSALRSLSRLERPHFIPIQVLGVIWAFYWWRWYCDDPSEHPAVNKAELSLIRGGLSDAEATAYDTVKWSALLGGRNLLYICPMCEQQVEVETQVALDYLHDITRARS